MESKKICVLGAGLSGITHALFKQTKGTKVTVFDKHSQVGGVLQSNRTEGYLMDYGANTLSLRTKQIENFLKRYQVLEHAIDANEKCSKRFIVKKNKVISLPQGFLSFLTSSFLSPMGKLRLCIEPFIPRLRENFGDESMASFVKRRLGKEALDYAANPFVGGVYASRPESLIIKHAFPSIVEIEKKYGSIIKGMIKGGINPEDKIAKTRLISFKSGMQELPIRLAKHLKEEPILNCQIKEISREASGQWRLYGQNQQNNSIEQVFDEVICTLPSHALKKIKWNSLNDDHLIEVLAQATHPPLTLTFLGYNRNQISHPLDGFGFLIPEVENRQILGTLFSSTLFSNRAPENKVLLTSFIGGERNPELCELNDENIISLSKSENQDLLSIKGQPEFSHLIHWPKSIPLPDHLTSMRINAAKTLNLRNPGITFSGSHISGAPLPNCIFAN